MTIDNAIKRLLDSEEELSCSQRIAIADLILLLKCCGNCRWLHNTLDGFECLRTCNIVTRHDKCEHWKPIE